MKILDCKKKICPIPVIETKKLLKETNDDIKVIVDNEIACENLTKMAKQLKIPSSIQKISSDSYEVFLKNSERENSSLESASLLDTKKDIAIIFNSDTMGKGDLEFSKTLLEGFIFSLSESDRKIKYIICYNRGVFLTTLNEKTVEDFLELEKKGTEIFSCGLCLENYKLKDKLRVGSITNMYKISEIILNCDVKYV